MLFAKCPPFCNSSHTRLCFYQTRSAWSMDQGSNRKHSAVHNSAPTVTKFCVMWEGQALPHDTKFSNCRCEIIGRRVIFIWSLIPGSSWSGLIKAEPGVMCLTTLANHIQLSNWGQETNLQTRPALVEIMAWHLLVATPLSNPMLAFVWLNP